MYTIQDDTFCTVSYGSKAEEYATQVAVEEFEALSKDALQRWKVSKASPLEFFIYSNRLDLVTVAKATGFFQFQIKRHCKPKIFAKLSERKLQKYAELFGISPDTLRNFDGTV